MFEPENPAPGTAEAKKKPLFIVKNGAAKERLVRADRRGQVESYVLQDFEIRKATVDECLALGRAGVEEEAVG